MTAMNQPLVSDEPEPSGEKISAPLIILLAEESDWASGLGGKGAALNPQTARMLARLIRNEGALAEVCMGWAEMERMDQKLGADCVFFHPSALGDEPSGEARRAWALARAAAGVCLVAYDLSTRHHQGMVSEASAALGFTGESCLFHLPGAAETLIKNARLGQALKERALLAGQINPAAARASRSI